MDQRVPKEAVWDALLYAAAPYAGQKELEEYYAADPNVVMPEKARKRMSLRIHRERKYREAHENYRPVLLTVHRIILALVIVLAGMMLVFLPSEKVRAAMWETVVEWGEESILVSFLGGEMADVPTEILEYREPRGIGEEFERIILKQIKHKYYIRYINDSKSIWYEQKTLTKNDIHISNEDTEGTEIMIGQYKGILNEFVLEGVVYISISYTDGEYGYTLCSNMSFDELIKTAESIK